MSLRSIKKSIGMIVRSMRCRYHFSARFQANVFKCQNVQSVAEFYSWKNRPIIRENDFLPTAGQTYHLNRRRLTDALLLASAARNACGPIIEIGTSEGRTTTLLSENHPDDIIHTLDILPTQSNSGKHITHVLPENEIGKIYKERGLENVQQYFADSRNWTPKIKDCGLAFIDGCHDYDYVISDTKTVLRCLKPGGYILWHDFNPDLIQKFNWLLPVVKAIDTMIKDQVITTPILYVEDSFTAITKIDC